MTINRRLLPLWIVLGIAALVLAATVFIKGSVLLYGLHSYKLTSRSMEPTLYEGDTFVSRLYSFSKTTPARGDVVVFRHGEYVLVKRLIGLPGDRVEGRDNVVSVNGKVLVEPYVELVGEAPPQLSTFAPVVVAPGTVFLLGDNRNQSLDSRMEEFGTFLISDITEKATFVTRSNHGRFGQAIH